MWAASAEIIRHFDDGNGGAGWPEANALQFGRMLEVLASQALPQIRPDVYVTLAGSKRNGGYNNRGLSAAHAALAVGVFNEDYRLYKEGLEAWKVILPEVVLSDGTLVEFQSRRDCHHAQYSTTALAQAAEIAWHQGDDLYSYKLGGDSSPRLARALQYLGGVLTGDVAYVEGGVSNYCVCHDPYGYDIPYNHYKNRVASSVNLSALEDAFATCSNMNPDNGERTMFLYWSALTHGYRVLGL